MSIHLILTTNSWGSYSYLHFMDEEIRAQKDEMPKIDHPFCLLQCQFSLLYWLFLISRHTHFARPNHALLLLKCSSPGFQSTPHSWFSSCLPDCSFPLTFAASCPLPTPGRTLGTSPFSVHIIGLRIINIIYELTPPEFLSLGQFSPLNSRTTYPAAHLTSLLR